MKILKLCWGLLLFATLIVVVQLADPPTNSPAAKFQRLPDVSLRTMAEVEWAAGRPEAALLLLDYVIENDLPDKAQAIETRQKIFAQLATENTPVNHLNAAGWAAELAGGNAFESLAGSTVADAVLYGEIADLAKQGALEDNQSDFVSSLNNIRSMSEVFPPAEGAIILAKAAHRAGVINESLVKQLRQTLGLMQSDPKSALAVEKFKDNFMPMFELARHCRTWGEFQTVLQEADSSDQLKVLTKMVAISPNAAEHLSQILAVASRDGRLAVSACLDHVMHQGPMGLDSLSAAVVKGQAGLKFVVDNPAFTPQSLGSVGKARNSSLEMLQERYQSLRYRYGAGAAALKYVVIAMLCGLLMLVVVPGRYLEKLVARPGSAIVYGPIHYLLSALAVGVVFAVLVYLMSLAVRPVPPPATAASGTGDAGAPVVGERADSAFLSGTVVLLSLAIHAAVWFYVRGKIRQVEDDEAADAPLRLKRLDNLDIFLDLPLFTGLALTVVAFILITLDAGMSRHFAYTSTVVGILSSVSLRVRYLYPLKERLIHVK
jgi:hypothetical protein